MIIIYGRDDHFTLYTVLKVYLEGKGVGEELTNFLLHHLHRKEQGQYVNWLQKLESFVAKPEWQKSPSFDVRIQVD